MSPAPDSTLADPQQVIANLRRKLAQCRTERDEALAQQTATAEVLGVINSSPGDLAPVFDAILEKALRLCGAAYVNLMRYDGALFHVAAVVHSDEIGERFRHRPPFQPTPDGLLHRIVRGEDVVFVEDVRQSAVYRGGVPQFRELVDACDYRSVHNIALRKDGVLFGSITILRKEARPLTDKQIPSL